MKELEQAFEDSAEWQRKSVWHTPNEEPQVFGEYVEESYPQIPCLVYIKRYGYGVRYWNVTEKCWDDEECDDFFCKMDGIEKWAYIDKL